MERKECQVQDDDVVHKQKPVFLCLKPCVSGRWWQGDMLSRNTMSQTFDSAPSPSPTHESQMGSPVSDAQLFISSEAYEVDATH
jgi:hypothetical protein